MSKSSIIKTFIFTALVLVSAFLFWQRLSQVFLKRNLSWQSLLWFGIWLLVFLVFWLFFSLLVGSNGICFLIYLAILAVFFLFFPFHYYLLIGLFVLFLIFIVSRLLIQKERNSRLKISLRAIFKIGLKLTLLFLALFLGLLAYFYPLVKVDEKGINLPPQILALIMKPLVRTISKVLPAFDPEMTVDETLAMTVVIQKPNLSELSPEILKKFQGKKINEINPQELLKDPQMVEIFKKQAKKINPSIISQQRNELAKNLGIEIKGDEKISELINKLASKQLQSLLGPSLKYLPIISAVLTFIMLNIIFLPFSWIVILFALLIFQIFLIFRVVKIEKVMKEGEDMRLNFQFSISNFQFPINY